MKIRFNTDTIKPMINWLKDRKYKNLNDEKKLRDILLMDDYQVEFDRYNNPNLPVCGITFEEAVDFFLNFDKKDFSNQRLQYKKEYFINFYNDLDNRIKSIEKFTSLDEKDQEGIETLLLNGVPDSSINYIEELNIILIVSIGNSMGWPHDHYVDYDVSNLDMFETKEDFIHVTAHEINHIFVGSLIHSEGVDTGDYFLVNFAYEGLAVHYNNNLATLHKEKKYDDKTYMMDMEDMEFYETHFDEIFSMIRNDYHALKGKNIESVSEVLTKYEAFEFMGKKIRQYPTYYFGCYLWGLIDLRYGKEKVFDAIENPSLFVSLYNKVANEKYRF